MYMCSPLAYTHLESQVPVPVCLSSKLAIKTLAGWGKKILDILFSCNTRTGFSDRNSGPKFCAVSIANDGK